MQQVQKNKRLFLVGFMGCGKSTVGNYIANILDHSFVDLDNYITQQVNKSIITIFDYWGELKFRQLESLALSKICQMTLQTPTIIALGGGTFVKKSNRQLISQNGISVWLKTSFETCLTRLEANLERPLLRNMEEAQHLYLTRQKLYSSADIHVETDNLTYMEVAKSIISQIQNIT